MAGPRDDLVGEAEVRLVEQAPRDRSVPRVTQPNVCHHAAEFMARRDEPEREPDPGWGREPLSAIRSPVYDAR
jgi:hypothetical protein